MNVDADVVQQSLCPVAQEFAADFVMRAAAAFDNHHARTVAREFQRECGACKAAADGYGVSRRVAERCFVS